MGLEVWRGRGGGGGFEEEGGRLLGHVLPSLLCPPLQESRTPNGLDWRLGIFAVLVGVGGGLGRVEACNQTVHPASVWYAEDFLSDDMI